MSLIGALNIGKSALMTQQAAIQVTSNNVANAGNPDYTRQTASVAPSPDQQLQPGMFIGTGVNLTAIQRQIDDALQGRIQGSISDSESANTQEDWLGRVESVFQSMGDSDLSSQMTAFFNSWSNLANQPQDISLRQTVVSQGQSLAGSFKSVLSGITSLQGQLDKSVSALTTQANGLADQVANLNEQIITAEGGSGPSANALRDQRDAVLNQLSQLMDIKVQASGSSMNVFVGSQPLVIGSTNRGLSLKEVGDGSTTSLQLIDNEDNGKMAVSSGQIGALLGLRDQIGGVADQVNALAGNLIFELNKVHASGQGLEGFSQATASNAVADTSAALNDSTKTGLAFTPTNGSFVIHVTQKGTGAVTSTLVPIDLDGLNGDDTSLQSLATTLNGIAGVSATISNGKLQISSQGSGAEISFSQDSSGVLAALGINSFYTGHDASDMAVNADLQARPSLLAAAMDGDSGDNQTALAIAGLGNTGLTGLNGLSLNDAYQGMINSVATAASGAKTNAQAAATVQDTLTNQREALSGVSLDEEAVNLMQEQRAFQGAARVISAVDDLMKTLLSM